MLGGRRGIPFTMEEIFNYMGFDYLRYSNHRSSFNIPCPICDRSGRKMHLNVNLEKKTWRCPKCGSYGNAVNYYQLVTTGRYEMSKEEYSETIKRLRHALGTDTVELVEKQKRPSQHHQIPSSEIASDAELNRTYQKMLEFGAFSLSAEHRESLLKRGLTEDAIERNGYRTFPEGSVLRQHTLQTVDRQYQKNNWRSIRTGNPMLKWQSDIEVKFGLTLAEWLQRQGCVLEGIPGFFKFCKRWCFLCPASGIMIPTRNMLGEIVGLQIRTDNGRLRYMTISSKGLDMAVTSGISRVHWPLQNSAIHLDEDTPQERQTELLVTEGPLKADVAQCLINRLYPAIKTAFVAIQGINNTAPLLADLAVLRKKGLQRVINALDMDRLTNINVMRGSKKLREALADHGLEFKPLLWDQDSAEELCEKYHKLFRALDIQQEPDAKNPFLAAAQYCSFVDSMKDLASRTQQQKSGLTQGLDCAGLTLEDLTWPSTSKGIDDFLLQQKNLFSEVSGVT